MSHADTIRRIVSLELKRRQAEHDAAQRRVDEAAEHHAQAMRTLQVARAEVLAITEARRSLDFNDGSGM